jgi:hypothetical protein
MRRLYAQLVDFRFVRSLRHVVKAIHVFVTPLRRGTRSRRSTLQVIKPLSSGSRVKKVAQEPRSSFMTFSRVEAYSQTILAGTKDYKSGYYGIEFSQANGGVLHLH